MKTQHTRGPWFLAQHKQNPANLVKVESLDRVICDAFGRSEEDRANARLIAAAPEMLAALQLIYANAGESPEWIRARLGPVIDRAEPRSS